MTTFDRLPDLLQIALLTLAGIPVMVLISALSLLAKRRVTSLLRARQTHRLVKKYAPYGLNPLWVPARLLEAIPAAAKWGALSDEERREAEKSVSLEEKGELARLVRGKENLIRAWARLPQAAGSEEARCFSVLLSVIEELGLIVTPVSSEVRLVGTDGPVPTVSAGKTIYFAPAPKTWLERLAGSILDLLLYLLLCPVYYFLLARAWVLLLPGFETAAGIAVVSIGCALLSLETVRLGRKLIAR